MKATLRGISGPAAGIEVTLEPGRVVSVGRHATCTVPVVGDPFLSGRHFEITLTERGIALHDFGSSNGTFFNKERIREQLFQGGETFLAGRNAFRVQIAEAQPLSPLDVLSTQPEPLYAVLDAARDPAIYPMLLTSGAKYTSLYTGQSALKLEAVSPYLAYLPPRCELLKKIVTQGWGNAWGIFLTSNQAPETVWHELRRSLMVTMEDTGKWVYFRFYDPRVLRVFMRMADQQQLRELTGTMSGMLMEDENPASLLHFHSFSAGCRVNKLPITPELSLSAGAMVQRL